MWAGAPSAVTARLPAAPAIAWPGTGLSGQERVKPRCRERVGRMEYIHLGRSGLSVSRLCLGTMNFGPLTSAGESEAIMDHAHEIGINFFDTANRYGGGQTPPGQVGGHD